LRKYYELGNIDEAVEMKDELVEKGPIHGNLNYSVPNVQP
jgi:pentatricopeptide repeat domain-containing protein 1